MQDAQLMLFMEVHAQGLLWGRERSREKPGRHLAGSNCRVDYSLLVHLELFIFLNKST